MSRVLSILPRRLAVRPSVRTTLFVRTKADYSKSLPSYLTNTYPTRTTALSNGIVVATEEQPNVETASVGVWVNTGSAHETEKNNGCAHFLEHMAFKGTGKRSQHGLELEIENAGASMNAYTSREQTAFVCKSFKNFVPNAIDILGDIISNPKLDSEDIEKERNTIIKEMHSIEDNTEEVAFDHLHAGAFQGTPLGRTILGPEKNIRSISRSDLQEYVKTYYTGPRIVVAAAGAVNHEEVVKHVQQAFGSISGSDNVSGDVPVDYVGSDTRIRNDDMPLAHILLAVRGVSWSDPDYFTAQLIQLMMGSWDRSAGTATHSSSNLCEMVATYKLAHSISSFATCYTNTGLIGNYAVVPPNKIDDLVGQVTDEWQRLANNVTQAEVDRNKPRMKSAIMFNLDNNMQVCEDIGRQISAIGRRITPAEIFLRINDITAADVRRVAKRLFTDVSPTVVAIGPIDDLPDYNIIRGWTYWNRL